MRYIMRWSHEKDFFQREKKYKNESKIVNYW